jgi:RNA polymerase sigma-70 factor (ECF subfamily)
LIPISSVAGDEVNLSTVPPMVIKTIPEAGSDEVDPAMTEIKVTFSKPMHDRNWSWASMTKASYPDTTGQPHYTDDKRTCVLAVKLAPGTTYAIWVNSEKFTNFKDAAGKSAVPYLLVFKTKP